MGWQDLLVGYPMAGVLAVVGLMLLAPDLGDDALLARSHFRLPFRARRARHPGGEWPPPCGAEGDPVRVDDVSGTAGWAPGGPASRPTAGVYVRVAGRVRFTAWADALAPAVARGPAHRRGGQPIRPGAVRRSDTTPRVLRTSAEDCPPRFRLPRRVGVVIALLWADREFTCHAGDCRREATVRPLRHGARGRRR